jgi:HK97 family phage major capsid protein
MKLKSLVRSLKADAISVDVEKRTARFSFSSEFPVDRWFGKEILSHEKSAADLSRFQGAANFLWNHDEDKVIGLVSSAEIGADKRGYCEVKFCEGEFADEKMRNMANGTLPNISFRYLPLEMDLVRTGKESEDEYLVTRWQGLEVSSVSIPADPTVGLGRSKDEQEIEVTVNNKNPKTEETGARAMDPIEMKKAKDEAAAEARKAERERNTIIAELGAKFAKHEGVSELARELLNSDKSLDECRSAFLAKIRPDLKPVDPAAGDVGMNARDLKQYSLVRALHAMANPNDAAAQKAAGFERELSDAAAKKSGQAARGFVVPVDVLRKPYYADPDEMKRALVAGTSTAGGNLIATDLMAGSFIDALRNKAVLLKAGARVIAGLVGNVAIPKLTGVSTAYWIAEENAPTAGAQTVGQVTMSPKTLAAYTDMSRQLLMQSSIDVELMVRDDIQAIIALELDRVGLYGTGSSNQPAGLKGLITQTKDFAGDDPTFAEIVYLETVIAAANADGSAMKYVTNATRRGGMKTTCKAGTFPVFIWEKDEVNGYPALVSNQVAAGDIFFGNWSDLLFGMWGGLDMLVDPYSRSINGTVRMTAFQSADVAVRHAESFSRGDNNL